MTEPRKRLRPTWPLFFNICYLAFAITFVIFVVRVWVNPEGVQARKNAAVGAIIQPLPNDNASSQDYKKDLELLEKEIKTQDLALAGERDELTRITEISKNLITVAGVFAFLLGFGSWKLLEDQQKAARYALDSQLKAFESQIQTLISQSEKSLTESLDKSRNSLKQVSDLRGELERDFPMFGRMRSNFQKILVNLQSTCSRLSDEDDSYTKLDWDEVQNILYYENAISTALLLNTNQQSGQLSEIYRLLGVFYGSRFAWNKSGIIGEANRDDLNRSRFYFDRSIDLNPNSYLTQFNAGYFTQFTDDPVIARVSRDHFNAATILGSRYQRPLISIALLELEAFKNSDAALAALDRASERMEYDFDRSRVATNNISYLRACALCLNAINASGKPDPTILQQALSCLSSACTDLSQSVCNNFDNDTKSFLYVLKDSQLTAQKFEEIADKVQTTSQQGLSGYN